jgi:superfamily II RNA helicase
MDIWMRPRKAKQSTLFLSFVDFVSIIIVTVIHVNGSQSLGKLRSMLAKLTSLQNQFGIQLDEKEQQDKINVSLMEAVYEWTRGMVWAHHSSTMT